MEETKKLEYQSPELTEYGSLEELTQRGGQFTEDAVSLSNVD